MVEAYPRITAEHSEIEILLENVQCFFNEGRPTSWQNRQAARRKFDMLNPAPLKIWRFPRRRCG